MSASEKLRALADYDGLHMPSDYIDRLDVISDALPLVADLVEAAEALGYGATTSGEDLAHRRQLIASVSALSEHLEGCDVT